MRFFWVRYRIDLRSFQMEGDMVTRFHGPLSIHSWKGDVLRMNLNQGALEELKISDIHILNFTEVSQDDYNQFIRERNELANKELKN